MSLFKKFTQQENVSNISPMKSSQQRAIRGVPLVAPAPCLPFRPLCLLRYFVGSPRARLALETLG